VMSLSCMIDSFYAAKDVKVLCINYVDFSHNNRPAFCQGWVGSCAVC
jgi:hypothetical protein